VVSFELTLIVLICSDPNRTRMILMASVSRWLLCSKTLMALMPSNVRSLIIVLGFPAHSQHMMRRLSPVLDSKSKQSFKVLVH
jgi:hypothetical protein